MAERWNDHHDHRYGRRPSDRDRERDRERERDEGERRRRARRGDDEGPRVRTFDEDEWAASSGRYGVGYGRDDDFEFQGYEGGFSERRFSGRDDYERGAGRGMPSRSARSGDGYGAYGESDMRRGGSGRYGRDGERVSHWGKGPQGYKRSDERIREDLCERLTDHDDIDARGLQVEVKDGEVRISGTVDNRYEKRLAEDIAENVSGVREVSNQIKVKGGFFGSLMGRTGEPEPTSRT